MTSSLDIKHFFRKAPREWLQRYFKQHGVLTDFDWLAVNPRNIGPLYLAWSKLDESMRAKTGEDFYNLSIVGTKKGKVAILDEAQFHPLPEVVGKNLGELESPLACAFWAFLERPHMWNGSFLFSVADLKGPRYWHTRINIPKLGRQPSKTDGDALGKAVAEVFMQHEARGHHCHVQQYRRRDLEYYYAHTADHRSMSLEFDDVGTWIARPHKPSFEVIFVHDDANQTLRIWHQGRADRIRQLQVAFAKAVLGADIPAESPRDWRVYDLDAFRDPDFVAKLASSPGVVDVEVRKMAVRVLGKQLLTIRISLGRHTPAHALYHRLERAISDLRPTTTEISSIGLRVSLDDVDGRKSRNVTLSLPNSSTLGDDAFDVKVREVLAEHDIEPKLRATARDDGSSDS